MCSGPRRQRHGCNRIRQPKTRPIYLVMVMLPKWVLLQLAHTPIYRCLLAVL